MDQWEKEEVIAKLKTEEVREKIREVHRRGRLKLGMIQTKSDPYWMDRFMILTCANKGYQGKTVSEIAGLMKVDPLDALFLLLEEDPNTVWVQHRDERYFEAALPVFLKHPNASPNTDWTCAPPGPPEGFYEGKDMWNTTSPIAYGLFRRLHRQARPGKASAHLGRSREPGDLCPGEKGPGIRGQRRSCSRRLCRRFGFRPENHQDDGGFFETRPAAGGDRICDHQRQNRL